MNYLKGDATHPQGEGLKLLCHIVNDKSVWGSGFVLALSRRWKEPELMYRAIPTKELGMIQAVKVENDIIVVNMIAQTLYKTYSNKVPLNYTALVKCLKKVNKLAIANNATIHAPKFGSGLGGGNWKVIEQLIEEIITVPVFIYEYEEIDNLKS
jgi:hypothetical protein